MPGLSALPEQRLPAAYRAALREELLRVVADTPRRRAQVRRRRRVLGSVAAAVLTSAGGAVAYSAITSQRPVTDPNLVRCYSVATYQPGAKFPGTSVGRANDVGDLAPVSPAIQSCAALWKVGVLQPGVRNAQRNPPRRKYAVPPLVECVLPGGQAAVFPAPAQCLALGLQEPTATPGG